MEHLIADSGIQFFSSEIEFNPSEPLTLSNGKVLKYTFVETVDFIEGVRTFNILCPNGSDGYIPVDELLGADNAVLRNVNGREHLDESGMVELNPQCDLTLLTSYSENTSDDPDTEIYSMNSLSSFRVKDPKDNHNRVEAFDLLLDKWLPMPMFREEIDGITADYPKGWCRMKMQCIGDGGQRGKKRYRLIWAFDTQTDEFSDLRPYVLPEENGVCKFTMCNKVDLLLNFLSSEPEFHAFSDYIALLLGLDPDQEDCSRRYKAFYIYFLNFIRLSGGAPEVSLYDTERRKNVDLVLDIGNSRTCGILFEDGEFTKGKMLELTDLSEPWMSNENKTFDMRVVFRKADFGEGIALDEEMFRWKSFVRIGEEARRLLYRSLEDEGISEKTTNYSSPKRYLWDHKLYDGQWENLITTNDTDNIKDSAVIAVPSLSKLFADDGSYGADVDGNNTGGELLDIEKKEHRYSRSSLMTFAFIEIFQHAITQINSIRYREKWGDVDVKRCIRNVIITCPTAMPLSEQIFLRQSARDAFHALTVCTPTLDMPEITPSPEALKVIDPYADVARKVWRYDEASCCQLVYLYAEITERYTGEINRFFEQKGHVRDTEKGQKSLTIGSVDIGAGTTDIMVCNYEYNGSGTSKVTPIPLFWDSFYLAGDDILRELIQRIIIEGKDRGAQDLGNVSSALRARILAMNDEELKSLPCYTNKVYKDKINDICYAFDEEERQEKKRDFVAVLIHDFFGTDSSMMGFRDRHCRIDFNTQISVPIAQQFMEFLRKRLPSRLYSFDELFPDIKPSSYLLDYFEHHFGFRFESLKWRYDPDEVADIVKSTMEPLMKQLALVLYMQRCDIILLAGRPTSLDAITELFIKYIPTSPDRLIRLNEYRVGSWFPTADGQGYFFDQKSVVAVGGMVGYVASHGGLKGSVLDFSEMIQKMQSTANYIGEYNSQRQQVTQVLLSPTSSTTPWNISVFPAFLGCRQLDVPIYQSRPLYALYNHGNSSTIIVRFSRDFQNDKEAITIEDAEDINGRNCKSDLELIPQSMVDDGKYWLDKGEFKLTINH